MTGSRITSFVIGHLKLLGTCAGFMLDEVGATVCGGDADGTCSGDAWTCWGDA